MAHIVKLTFNALNLKICYCTKVLSLRK